jgi:hypothetical protein
VTAPRTDKDKLPDGICETWIATSRHCPSPFAKINVKRLNAARSGPSFSRKTALSGTLAPPIPGFNATAGAAWAFQHPFFKHLIVLDIFPIKNTLKNVIL